MVTFNSCVDEQQDFLLGALNQAQDFFGDKTYAEVFSEYGELFGLTGLGSFKLSKFVLQEKIVLVLVKNLNYIFLLVCFDEILHYAIWIVKSYEVLILELIYK